MELNKIWQKCYNAFANNAKCFYCQVFFCFLQKFARIWSLGLELNMTMIKNVTEIGPSNENFTITKKWLYKKAENDETVHFFRKVFSQKYARL